MNEQPCQHRGLGRRHVLGMAGGSAAAVGLASLLGAAPAGAAPGATAAIAPGHRPGGSDKPLRFAVVTDTHINLTNTQSTTWLAQIYAALATREPDFVLHCGDIADTGQPDEYDRYAQILPDALRGKIHYSPGNHDTRWDPTAKQLYRAHFGPAPYSFDAGGIHIIGFDPSEVLQEPGHYGPGGFAWLEADLRRLPPGTPAVLFQHFPLGNSFYYVDDQPAVLDHFAGYNLRGIFAGHIHREDISHFNGLTQVAMNAVLNAPVYYWVEKSTDGGGMPVLQVSRVSVAADGTQTEVPLSTMPLTGTGQGRAQRPRQVLLGRVGAGVLPVTVRLTPDAGSPQVGVQPYPQAVFGGSSAPAYQALTADGDRFTGTVDVSALAPGQQRLQVRVQAADGTWWEQTNLFTVPGGARDPRQRWQYQMPGAAQGGIALAVDAKSGRGSAQQDSALLVAGSSGGQVVALRTDGSRVWRAQTGPVYRQPGADAAGETVFVPSADHHLYALDARTGHRRWQFDAGAPVLGAPEVSQVDGQQRVVFSAGQGLFALDTATGHQVWSVPDSSFSSGRPACDGERVYAAGADGYARAYDARTGQQLWAYQMVTGDEHHLDLYSGWDAVVAVGGGLVVVATVSNAIALDAATGAKRWTVSGSTMYAPALILDDATCLLTTEWGVLTLVHLATGATIWQNNLALRVFNAGVVVNGDTAWVLTVDGKLIGVRLADGARAGWLQHSLVYTFGRPAVTGGMLAVGDQNGVVHGIRLR
ncbi:outer membrane protein assembly factor BamB family protein [Rugosimonospora africana]|uniref:outer membrane protein assembly factor BamB family protein n=1 Tax=Rugosimonospora africana TaxID=556532 RepID=UPI001942CF2D|nr:PQQ-binding-like beta-propeller repeat protein [Rugosimonospora africana]